MRSIVVAHTLRKTVEGNVERETEEGPPSWVLCKHDDAGDASEIVCTLTQLGPTGVGERGAHTERRVTKVRALNVPQLIFRKVSDMKREKELAERRKNEPKLDQNQDHLVRKIFSRFRKGQSTSSTNLLPSGSTPAVSNGPCGSQSGTPSHGQRDVERGELTHQTSAEDAAAAAVTTAAAAPASPRRDSRVSLVRAAKEDETGGSSRASSAKSKWGRMLRGNSNSVDVGGSIDSSTTEPPAQLTLPGLASKLAASKGSAGDPSAGPGRAQSAGGSGNKVHPKLSRVPERQETSDEQAPASTASNPRLLRADAVHPPDSGSPSGSHHLLDSPSIIESFSELKHEVRNEVQRINHKMSRLEDILGEILVRLTPPAAPHPLAPPPARSSAGRTRSSQPTEPDDAPVVVDVDGSSAGGTGRPRLANRAKAQGSAGKARPRSSGSGSGEKLTTQFQEYV